MQLLITFIRFFITRSSKNAAALRKAISATAPKRARKVKGAA